MSPEFLLTTLILVVTPGTGVLFTMAAGLARGVRAGVLAAFACTLGTVPHIAAAITGLAALLHTSAVAFQVVKYLGVAYLLYMAWATFRDRGALTVDEEDAAPRSARQVIVSGVLVNILNPKLSIFFVAFLPQFVSPGSPALPQMLALSARLHGGDVPGLRGLRPLRRVDPQARHHAAPGPYLDAPDLRRRVRRPGRQAGAHGALDATAARGRGTDVAGGACRLRVVPRGCDPTRRC